MEAEMNPMMWWLSAANAGPTAEIHAWGAAGAATDDDAAAAGLGVAGGLRFVPSVSVELLAQGGVSRSVSPWVALRPELRWSLTDPASPAGALALVGGVGLGLGPTPVLRSGVGLALDLPSEGTHSWRIQARALLDGAELDALQVTVGTAWPRVVAPAPPPPIEPPPAPPPPAPNSLQINPPTAMIWLPQPYAGWVTPSEANRLMADAAAGLVVRIAAPGYLSIEVAVDGPTAVALDTAPAQGALLVMASPGDLVRMGEHDLPANPDGLRIINAPEGFADLTVVGGGRQTLTQTALSQGHALWVRIPRPAPLLVTCPAGRSDLSAKDREALAALTTLAGDWAFEVRGTASPEGDPAVNLDLATRRGLVVVDAMVAAGLPRARITLATPMVVAEEGVPVESMRGARVRAIPPVSAP
jgi:hypothetical protein